jgi:hypothetical protein
MRPSRRPCVYALLAALACTLAASRTRADTLTITTDPPGATVEIDGLVAGTTPYQTEFPGGYFHKTHMAFNARLEHSMVARVSKKGYLAQQVTLTSGPFDWIAVTGRRRGNYFLLKSDHFHIKLQERSPDEDLPLDTIEKAGPLPRASSEAPRDSDSDAKTGLRTGTVSISSDFGSSEIYVDGKFVGQTPSTIALDAGTHRVEVKIQGKKNWERDLEVLPGSQVTLRADFREQR